MGKKEQKVNEDIGKFGMWVNDNIVGNPVTFVLAIISVIVVYSFLLFQTYAQWNTGIGLFYNTLSSSFELITGVGAVVGVVVLHKKAKKAEKRADTADELAAQRHADMLDMHETHAREVAALHTKLDDALGTNAKTTSTESKKPVIKK